MSLRSHHDRATDLVMRLSMRLPDARLEAPMPTVCSGVRPVGEANTGLTGPDMGSLASVL